MELIRILAGDARFFWTENIHYFRGIPQAWDASLNTGIGQSGVSTLWISGYLYLTNTLTALGVPWSLLLITFWLLPAVLMSFFSLRYLFAFVFPQKREYRFLAGMIYVCNSYFILNFSGGQTGVLLAYSVAPLVILRFIKLFHSPTLHSSILSGLFVSLLLLFDPRFVFLSGIVVFLYWVFMSFWRNLRFSTILMWFFIPGVVMLLLHNYWIVPLLFFKSPSLPQNFDAVKGFEFFSFADFSHAISMLHPNWPENLFGKTYFLEPWFLFVPLVAYASLLFLRRQKPKSITNSKLLIFLGFLGLLGVFLAKGVNEPFGEVNIWIFTHIPGMTMFRDPTKFYFFIILSYSMLIPWTVSEVFERYVRRFIVSRSMLVRKSESRQKKHWIPDQVRDDKIRRTFFILFVTFWVLLHIFSFLRYPVTLQPVKKIPAEYVALKDFILSSGKSYRTLWIPQWQRYGYFSPLHPAIGRGEIIGQGDSVTLAKRLEKKNIQDELQLFGVRYIILPSDSEGELFINDRHYDNSLYQKTKTVLDANRWLRKVKTFGTIQVYEVPNPSSRFSINNEDIGWKYISSSHYQISLKKDSVEKKVIFSEAFDPQWVAMFDGKVVHSQKHKDHINSFLIMNANDIVDIYYQPQSRVTNGLLLSGFVSVLLGFYLLKNPKNKER